ncbi:MAG: C39 family peptidase [Limisphaerales bacterium]
MKLESDLPTLVIFTNAAAWPSAASGPASADRVLESPPVRTARPWNELVVSWNVEPAVGSGVVVEAQALLGERWTRWYRLGDWSLDGLQPVRRTSWEGESDADGEVKTDTLVMRGAADGVRVRLKLVGTLAEMPDRLRWVGLAVCDSNDRSVPRAPRLDVRGLTLDVPERSQVSYAEGRAWCSPTSVSMLLGWWAWRLGRPELDRDVPEVAAGVHDPGWPGTGNWPFNTAYAGSFPGMRSCAARLRDLRDVEDLVAAGIPVVLSVNAPALRGEPLTPDGGHLVICVGFTGEGDLVVNDPWARLEEGQRVRKVVLRGHAERAWEHAHRMAYLVAPEEIARAFPAVWR